MTDNPHRWVVRGADEVNVRRLRVLALHMGVPMSVLVNEAIQDYLVKHNSQDLKVMMNGVEWQK